MNTTRAKTVSRAEIQAQVVKTYINSATLGDSEWWAVRVSPDGEISEVCAAARQFLESTNAPRSVFVWSAMANAVDPEQIPDENDPSWDDWFDLNVPGLEDLLEPTGLELAE